MGKVKKIVLLGVIGGLVLLAGLFLLINRERTSLKQSLIISSSFIGYDFSRVVVGEEEGIKMLLKPGTEAHDFEPTPQDIIDIKNADLFVYIGGESEEWIEKLILNNEIDKNKTLRLMDLVELKDEEVVEGMEDEDEEDNDGDDEEEHEYDEHILTSPRNAMILVEGIRNKLSEMNPEKASIYEKNAKEYLERLNLVDQEIREVVKNGNKKELIFGDRFPFRYFTDEYGLNYFAAFPGCSEQTEASSRTVAFLVNKAREDGVKVILKIELTDGKLAETIADEIGAKVLELSAMHNISEEDFNNGVTYIDLMERNIEVLAEALE